MMFPESYLTLTVRLAAITVFLASPWALAQTSQPPTVDRVAAGLFPALTEPPCSYCSTQHRKGLIEGQDRVVA